MVKRSNYATILTKPMRTGRFADWKEDYSKPPLGKFACSNRFHRRVFLGLDGEGASGGTWTKLVTTNHNYVAWVCGASNQLDGGGDYSVRLADFKSGKPVGGFSPAAEESGDPVTALALSPAGAIGWIVGYSTHHRVWMRTRGRSPQLLDSGATIDPAMLRFGNVAAGRGLIWSTGDSVTKSPAT